MIHNLDYILVFCIFSHIKVRDRKILNDKSDFKNILQYLSSRGSRRRNVSPCSFPTNSQLIYSLNFTRSARYLHKVEVENRNVTWLIVSEERCLSFLFFFFFTICLQTLFSLTTWFSEITLSFVPPNYSNFRVIVLTTTIRFSCDALRIRPFIWAFQGLYGTNHLWSFPPSPSFRFHFTHPLTKLIKYHFANRCALQFPKKYMKFCLVTNSLLTFEL